MVFQRLLIPSSDSKAKEYPSLVVMGGGSHPEGRGFEYWRRILDGHDIFHIDLL